MVCVVEEGSQDNTNELEEELTLAKKDLMKVKLELQAQTLAATRLAAQKANREEEFVLEQEAALEALRESLTIYWEEKLSTESKLAKEAADAAMKQKETVFEEEIVTLKQQMEDINDQKKASEAESANDKALVSTLSSEVGSLKEQLANQEQILTEEREARSGRESILEVDMRSLRARFDSEHDKVTELERQLDDAQVEITSLREQLDEQKDSDVQLKESLDKTTERILELESAKVAHLELEAKTALQCFSFEKENEALQDELVQALA